MSLGYRTAGVLQVTDNADELRVALVDETGATRWYSAELYRGWDPDTLGDVFIALGEMIKSGGTFSKTRHARIRVSPL